MYIDFRMQYLLFLSDFNETWIISTDLRKIFEYQFPLNPPSWKPNGSMRTDGQTDMTELIVAFCNFANTPKNNIYGGKYRL